MVDEKDELAQDYLSDLNDRLKRTPVPKRKSGMNMAQVEKVLPEVLNKLGLDRRLKEHALMQIWSTLLPVALSSRSRPLFIDSQQQLVIGVKDASVAQELSLMKSKLLQSLAAAGRSLGVELRGLRMDMKNFHRLEEKAIPAEIPLPQPEDRDLDELTLNARDMKLIGELSTNLSFEAGTKPELNVKIVSAFERQLRLAEWRHRHGYPICEACQSPVSRLFLSDLTGHKVCFNCSVSQC